MVSDHTKRSQEYNKIPKKFKVYNEIPRITRSTKGALSRTEWYANVQRGSKEYKEMPRNTKEYTEIHRNTRKYKRNTK